MTDSSYMRNAMKLIDLRLAYGLIFLKRRMSRIRVSVCRSLPA